MLYLNNFNLKYWYFNYDLNFILILIDNFEYFRLKLTSLENMKHHFYFPIYFTEFDENLFKFCRLSVLLLNFCILLNY